MPPTDRFVISFAAEPPQETLPYGRWANTLAEHFRSACEQIDTEGAELGDFEEIAWFPDRTYAGRTYVPGVTRTAGGYEIFGYVAFGEGRRRDDFVAARLLGYEQGRIGTVDERMDAGMRRTVVPASSRRARTSPPRWPTRTRTGSWTSTTR